NISTVLLAGVGEGLAFKGALFDAAPHVVASNGTVAAPGGELRAVRTKGQPRDGAGVGFQGVGAPAGGEVREIDHLVLAGGGNCPPVGTDGHGIETGDVPLARKQLLAGGSIDGLDVGGIVLQGNKENLAVAAGTMENAYWFSSNFHR